MFCHDTSAGMALIRMHFEGRFWSLSGLRFWDSAGLIMYTYDLLTVVYIFGELL